jgi:hypothetical protein
VRSSSSKIVDIFYGEQIGDSAGDLSDDRGDRRGRLVASRSAVTLPVTSGIMADLKGARTSAPADNAGVHVKNAINMAMEDLTEDDMKEVERELEEEMVEL